MKKQLLRGALACLMLGGYTTHAQDIHFSQFYESSILRNPSLTGIFTGDYKVGVSYREQWSSISKPFQTAYATAEARIPVRGQSNDFVSVGLLSYYDKAGSLNMSTITVYPAINYSKSINAEKASFLSVGFTGGFIQRSYDPSKATFDNQYQNDRFDPAYATGESLPDPTFTQWDMGAGFSYNATTGQDNNISYIVGLGGYHFSRPKYSFYNDKNINTDIRWNANAGVSVQMSEVFSYQVHANYMNQGSYNELIFGGMLGWNKMDPGNGRIVFAINGGVFYRYRDAVIPTLKIKYQDYSFGLSYDVNASKLATASKLRGGVELTVFKTGLFRNPEFEHSRTICPHFFY